MRNLKKVLAVILTVAMLASLMVPAFAAVSNLEEAKKLQAIGLFAGGEADLKLDEDVTRIQGLTFAIRAAGKEDEALAMTDEEVAAELAKFNDAADIPAGTETDLNMLLTLSKTVSPLVTVRATLSLLTK